ncbi:MAG: hypothetical protein ACOVSR_15155 [Bacteroidia bacterium]
MEEKQKLEKAIYDTRIEFKRYYGKFSEDKKESAIAKIKSIILLLENYNKEKFKFIINNLNISLGLIDKCKKQKTIKSSDYLFSDEIKRADTYLFDATILLN